ncbi:MAG: nucleotidyltransferase family protein [Geminicoccaceae bacterium]
MSFARLADRHLVTPMLARYVTRPDVRRQLPEEFGFYVEFFHRQNRERNERLKRELLRVVTYLNGIGVEPLLLKGAIRLVDDLYPDLGWRFLRDLDLLVPADQVSQVADCLTSFGYRFTIDADYYGDDHRHLPPLKRDDADTVVEIHTELLRAPALLSADSVLCRSHQVKLGDVLCRVPDRGDQLRHLIGHDRFDDELYRCGAFLLRSIFEIALICRDESSLEQLLSRCSGTGLARYADVWLALTTQLFPGYVAMPLAIKRNRRLMAQALLRVEQVDEAARMRRFVSYGWIQLERLFSMRN